VNAPEVSYVAVPAPEEPALVGTLTTIGKQDRPDSFPENEAPQPVIDNQDRERLLSILSKD
jgi:hypothetical protein